MAPQSQPLEQTRRRLRPEVSAWLILFAAFMTFCAIVAGIGVAGWRYYTEAMWPVDGTLLRGHVIAAVTYQSKDSSILAQLEKQPRELDPCPNESDACEPIGEGTRIVAKPKVGYGPVASLVLADTSQVDLYAHPTGADLTLKTYQASRWTKQRQEVVFEQAAGYARYDLTNKDRLPYPDISYRVIVDQARDVSILLEPGGSYSINVPHADAGQAPALTESGAPLLVDIAVRAGSAEIHSPRQTTTIRAGQKLQVDIAGMPGAPVAAQWQLIHDGSFEQSATGVYTDGIGAWLPYTNPFDPTVTDAEKNGKFKIYRGCRPDTPAFCGIDSQTAYIGQFDREGNQPKSFGVGIWQTLDLDVSEYRSLRFSLRARVTQQSIVRAGIQNSECPVTIQLVYKQQWPSDPEENRYICVYQENTDQPLKNNGEWTYRAVDAKYVQWYSLAYELRDKNLLPSARYLQKIIIYANGHDYISEVTDISLIATQ